MSAHFRLLPTCTQVVVADQLLPRLAQLLCCTLEAEQGQWASQASILFKCARSCHTRCAPAAAAPPPPPLSITHHQPHISCTGAPGALMLGKLVMACHDWLRGASWLSNNQPGLAWHNERAVLAQLMGCAELQACLAIMPRLLCESAARSQRNSDGEARLQRALLDLQTVSQVRSTSLQPGICYCLSTACAQSQPHRSCLAQPLAHACLYDFCSQWVCEVSEAVLLQSRGGPKGEWKPAAASAWTQMEWVSQVGACLFAHGCGIDQHN
jgi:hypothetical protein